MKKYTLIVPVFNEEKIVYKNMSIVYKLIKKIERKLKCKINLTILNDGSYDSTSNEISKLIKKYDITYVYMRGPTRRENLLSYIDNYVTTEYVGFIDCDLATDLKDLEKLFKYSVDFDIVTGNRYAASSKVTRSINRTIISLLFNNFMKIVFGSKIDDHECGFKMFKTYILKSLLKYTKYGEKYGKRKMFWDTEMWIYAQKLKLKILEIPIDWKEGHKSALRFKSETSMIPYILKFLVKYLWMRKKLIY